MSANDRALGPYIYNLACITLRMEESRANHLAVYGLDGSKLSQL
jgi:hypothetical protein